uniref:Uncharacterized protein n=1 Tax=Rhipicephalus zambeziensis TaxID=60191 RepID=A0A224Y8Z7_9ACAR
MAEPGSIVTGDAKAARRARMAAAKRQQRARDTDEDRARRAEAQRLRRAGQDEETKAALREAYRLRKAAQREKETEEAKAARRESDRRRKAALAAAARQDEETKAALREAHRLRKAAQREKETEEAKAARRASDRRRKAAVRAQRRVAETLWQHGTSADEQLSCDVVVRDDVFGVVCSVCDRLWFDGDAVDSGASTPALERDAVELESDGAWSGDAVKAFKICPACRLTLGNDSSPLQAMDVHTAPLESTSPGGVV